MVIVKDESLIISPDDELTIKTVQVFYDELSQFLATDYKKVLLNLIGVINIDSAGFQLLVALKKEVVAIGKSFEIIGISSEVDDTISLYGANKFFEN